MIETNKTAVLIFSRTPEKEAAVKTFHSKLGIRSNTTIAHHLIKESISVARKSNLKVFSCFGNDQVGESFGERLANSMEIVFDKGYDRIIAIGNDCPSLTTESILKTDELLDSQEIVLGPATDGGVYLIGINSSAFHRQRFIELSWETEELQQEWKNYSKDHTTNISWLATLNDIDDHIDFEFFLNSFPYSNALSQKLKSIIASTLPSKHRSVHLPNILSNKVHLSLRAPPF